MLNRLANVIFWACTLAAAALSLFAVYQLISELTFSQASGNVEDALGDAIPALLAAFLLWLAGWGSRYILVKK